MAAAEFVIPADPTDVEANIENRVDVKLASEEDILHSIQGEYGPFFKASSVVYSARSRFKGKSLRCLIVGNDAIFLNIGSMDTFQLLFLFMACYFDAFRYLGTCGSSSPKSHRSREL